MDEDQFDTVIWCNRLETFSWDPGPCWHDCISQFLQICPLHIHAAPLPKGVLLDAFIMLQVVIRQQEMDKLWSWRDVQYIIRNNTEIGCAWNSWWSMIDSLLLTCSKRAKNTFPTPLHRCHQPSRLIMLAPNSDGLGYIGSRPGDWEGHWRTLNSMAKVMQPVWNWHGALSWWKCLSDDG